MVSPALKAYFTSHGVSLISLDDGAREFIHLLTGPEYRDTVQVIVGSPPPQTNRPPSGKLQRVHRIFRRELNPFLEDHQIGGRGVLPATCAASWMAHTVEQVYPGMTAAKMEEYKVLKGLVFSGNDPQDLTTEVRQLSMTPEEAEVEVSVSSPNGGKFPLNHYSGRFTLYKSVPPPPEIRLPTVAEENRIEGAGLYTDGTCFHGPAFRGIQAVYAMNENGLIMKALLPSVPSVVQGQFPVRFLNPFLNDVIVQSLLVWSQKRLQAPCLPSYARLVQQYRPLRFDSNLLVQLEIQSVNETAVIGDITVWDENQLVALQIKGLQGTISVGLKRLLPAKEALNA